MSQNTPLTELKSKVEAHLKNELDLMLLLAKLDEGDAKEFGDWFRQHPYTRGIDKIMQFCRTKKSR